MSSTALGCLDRQLREALDLAVSCRLLSDWSRTAGDALTAVALDCLSDALGDQAAILARLAPPDGRPANPSIPEPSTSKPEACLAELDRRLSRAALVAQTDAMIPGLEKAVAGMLWSLAALYCTRRELLLVCTLLDSA